MGITLATDNLDQDTDDDLFQEEDVTYNFRELMDEVSKLRDCIITVPADQVEDLRLGLITRKAKDNAKLKNSGLLPDNMVLAFLVYPAKKDGKEIPGLMDVRVKLRPKKGVQVVEIRVPDDL